MEGNENLFGREPGQATPPVKTGSDVDATDNTVVEAKPVEPEAPAVEPVEAAAAEPEAVQPEAPAVEPVETKPVEPEAPAVEPVETAAVEPMSTEEAVQHEDTEGSAEA